MSDAPRSPGGATRPPAVAGTFYPAEPERLSSLVATLLAGWIATELGAETPWHVSRFFPTYRLTDLDPTPVATIQRAVAIGRAAGLRHVYSGNVADADEDTRCAGCGETLIRRQGFRSVRAALVGGRCARCGHSLAGVGLDEWVE